MLKPLDDYIKMSARPEAVEALKKSTVTYEDLAEIEKQFDDAETEISEWSLWLKWLHQEEMPFNFTTSSNLGIFENNY